METELLKTVGQIAGVGGVALGILFLVFREVLREALFPRLTRDQAYRLMRFIILATWSVAIVGLLTWGWVETRSAPDRSSQSPGTGSASVETGIAITGGSPAFHGPVNIGDAPVPEKP